MRVASICILFAAACLVAKSNAAETLELPDGLQATLWAKTPQLYNPTNIDVDAKGRVWVTEGVNYRETWKKQNALKHPDGDRVVILEDTDGDGVADSSKVFVQDKDLLCPLGIAVLGDKVIVSCSPSLIIYQNADDKPAKKEIFLNGFGGRDHDHGLHSLIGFLDGRWYFNVGNDGPHEVRDAGGWWLHSGSCYVYGPTGNTGNRKSDDGRVWTGGIALRIDPDGKHLTPLGHNFRNSYEIALDSFGDMWQSDNDDDGNRGCRFSWLMEGANMGYFCPDGTRAWAADKRPDQSTLTAHWHQDDPGVVPLQDNTGAGGPTGSVVYEGGLLPDKYIGCILDCDAGRNIVRVHRPIPDGAGYKFERTNLIEAKFTPTTQPSPDDRSNWFRPSDVCIGTDGAIYVADWYDPGVGGHAIGDKNAEGRIFRIAPKGDHTRPPKIDLDSVSGQLAALNNPAINIRYQAANKLAAGGESSVAPLLGLIANDTPYYRARAIWVLSRCGDPGVQAVEKIFKEGDERARLAAFRALRSINHDVVAHADILAGDLVPALRREAAIALRDVPFDQCKDMLVKLAKGYDGHDRFYLEAFGIACDRKEEAVYPLVLDACGCTDSLKWSEQIAGLAWRLHPRAAIDALAARAASAALSPEQRKQAIDAIAFINDERAASAMAQLTESDLSDVHELATWWAKNRVTNDWSSYAAARPFASNQPSAATTQRVADRATLLDEHATDRSRQQALARLAANPEGAIILISLAADGQFPRQYTDLVADRLTRNSDLGVRALASQYFPRKTSTGTPLPPLKELAALKGEARAGRNVFFGPTASCYRCHRFDGEGKDIGPDLTSIRTKYQRLELLDNILNPSANIAFGYEAWIVKMKDGQVYSGFILADGEKVLTIKESSGEQRQLLKDQIVLRKKQPFSVMPDNVALGLSAQQLADLAEFLLTMPVKPR